jgi:hypothetical protein
MESIKNMLLTGSAFVKHNVGRLTWLDVYCESPGELRPGDRRVKWHFS